MKAMFTLRSLLTGILFAWALTGCGEKWEYHAIRAVQTDLPRLMDSQWSRKRDYSEAEMLAVRASGSQTVLIGCVTRQPVYNDVAQLDEAVSRTFVLVLDDVQAGKTYHITPESGRVIEGTSFRPAWRPYRGLEGDVTILSASSDAISAAVRVSGLSIKPTDPERSMRGVHSFKIATGAEPELSKAQISFQGGPTADTPADEPK